MNAFFRHIAALCLTVLLCTSLAIPMQVYAAQPKNEATVKIGYLYNFMKYVNWPQEAKNQNFFVCFLGNNPFGDIINSLSGKVIRNRPIRVVDDLSLSETKYCHVVFVSRSELGLLSNILIKLRQSPLLTISDIEGFTTRGGIIELITKPDGDIKFCVSQKGAKDVGLHISSKLLSLSEC